jgi:hypothetical protein
VRRRSASQTTEGTARKWLFPKLQLKVGVVSFVASQSQPCRYVCLCIVPTLPRNEVAADSQSQEEEEEEVYIPTNKRVYFLFISCLWRSISLAESCCICNTLSMGWQENRKRPTGLVKHFTSIDMDSRNYNKKLLSPCGGLIINCRR